MTNPACHTCGGWGFKNKIVGDAPASSGYSRNSFEPVFDPPGAMIFCDDVYPSHDRIPPELRGQPCTPRTDFQRREQVVTRNMMHKDSMQGGMRLRTEKAAETRAANKAAKAAQSGDNR